MSPSLHPNPLSGWSEDYPDPEDEATFDDEEIEAGLWALKMENQL